jgi:DNA invertase Pin-like site-specific DNA recombinase
MKGASQEELLEATENLTRYLKALYAMFLRAEMEKAKTDSCDMAEGDKLDEGNSQRATPSMKAYFAYIRVSTIRQGQFGSSLQEQRDAITTFAQRQGFAITEWFEDRETAAKNGRTQFIRMMTQLEKNKATGVLLHKIDRGARNLWDWARIQGLLDRGLEVHFVHDNLDMTSRGGRLAADIQAVVAADYVRNLRDEVRKGLTGRLKQGLYPFRAPIGYLDQGGGKPKVIDPVNGPLIRLAFELYASRQHSFATLRTELLKRGLSRRGGGALHPNSLADILHNPFYAGIISVKASGETYAGVHEPLISASLFKRVQDVLKSKNIETVQRQDFLYSRLLKCKHCNTTLIGERQKGIAYYRCHTRGCSTKCIREDFVSKRLFAATVSLRFADHDVEEMRPVLNKEDADQAKALEAAARSARLRVSAIMGREGRLTDAYVDQVISRDAYEGRKAAVHLELAEARDSLNKMEQSQRGFALISQCFFEFANKLDYKQAQHDAAGFREVVREATLNWIVAGKDLYITLRSPFRELSDELGICFGGPYRGVPRTFMKESTDADASPLRSADDYRRVVKILKKHLAGWEPPASLFPPSEKSLPTPWKKNLLNQSDDEDFKQAA